MLITRSSSILLVTISLVSGLTLSCNKHQSTEGVVATVNGAPIMQEDVTFASSRRLNSEHEHVSSDDKASVLEDIILQELASQRALKLGLDADPKYQAELRGLEAQVNAFKRKKLSEMYLEGEMLKETSVSDEEAQQYFNDHAAQLRTEINVWEILRRDEDSIQGIHAELAQGVPFEKAVGKLFPSSLLTADRKPWELGYLQWKQVPEAWQDVLKNMKAGETSDIIRGPNNRFWIIKLIDKRENKDVTFEQLKPMIIDILKAEKTDKLRETTIQNLKNDAKIIYSK